MTSVRGLYAFDVHNERDQPVGAPAAVLLVDAKAFPHALNEFQAAEGLAAHWEDVDPASIRSFLVCTLYAIQLESQK